MRHELTREFAQKVDLSLNPFERHRQVGEMLEDPTIVGEGIEVLVNPDSFQTERDTTIAIHTFSPILGRRTLKKAAACIEFVHGN